MAMPPTIQNQIIYRTSVEQKLKAKTAAKEFRYGSPKLRDMLREKCRIRIKNARQECFSNARNIQQEQVLRILREEISQIEDDYALQEAIYAELIEEFNNKAAEFFESEEQYLIESAESNPVFCPVCQKYCLQEKDDEFACNCGVSFNYNGSLEILHDTLDHIVDEHSKSCDFTLSFFTEPNVTTKKSNLTVLCQECNYILTL